MLKAGWFAARLFHFVFLGPIRCVPCAIAAVARMAEAMKITSANSASVAPRR